MEEKEWCYGTDEEILNGDGCESREEAILTCIRENDCEVGDLVHVGTKGEFKPRVSASMVIDQIQENAFERCGDSADDYLHGVSKEAKERLSIALTKVFTEWANEEYGAPHFWPIDNCENIEVTQDLLNKALNEKAGA
ncbi:hypothetical protein [Bdellovibrio sp. HCB288]|uniref:hypothetical protein n=1 Tax=Bdellovibrio sp. HCB288 TaxID=3394355 RepID=UPI0039B63BBE